MKNHHKITINPMKSHETTKESYGFPVVLLCYTYTAQSLRTQRVVSAARSHPSSFSDSDTGDTAVPRVELVLGSSWDVAARGAPWGAHGWAGKRVKNV